MTIQADFSGALKKTAMLHSIPKAAQLHLTKWATKTIQELKLSVRERLSKSGKTPGKKTGQLWRNIGMETNVKPESYQVIVGTGVQGKVSVKYARIQDEGGTTHPRVTPRMRRFGWAMFKKTGDPIYKAIALTKKDRLDVRIPASRWFTDVIKQREPELKSLMDAGAIQATAEKMGGGNA